MYVSIRYARSFVIINRIEASKRKMKKEVEKSILISIIRHFLRQLPWLACNLRFITAPKVLKVREKKSMFEIDCVTFFFSFFILIIHHDWPFRTNGSFNIRLCMCNWNCQRMKICKMFSFSERIDNVEWKLL